MTAAIYSRISRDPLEEGAGVDRQETDCRKLLARQGFTDPVIYRDNNRSAWKRDRRRPAWDELLTAVRAGTVTTLAVWHPDRLMRQPRDLEELLDAADRFGVRLLSAGGGRNLADPDDRFVLRIEIAAACKSSDDTSRRLRRVLEDRAAAGLVHGGPRPFGLDEARTGLDQAEATLVRTAVASLLDGRSLRSVCAMMNASGLPPTGKGTEWSPATVRQMLRRPSIAGLQTHRGQVIGRTAHPAVLGESAWRAVVEVLTDPSRRITRSSAYAHLLTGLLFCGRCDGEARMRSITNRWGGQYACARCFRCAAAERAVDVFVTEAVDRRLARSTLPVASGRNAAVLADLAAARGRLEEATREFADDPDVSPAQLRVVTRRLRIRIVDLERQAAADVLAARAPVAADWQSQPLPDRRAVVAMLIERIVLARAGGPAQRFDPARLTISWR